MKILLKNDFIRHDPILVVGTTPDYVVKIEDKYPGISLFLMRQRFKDDPMLENIPHSLLLYEDFESDKGTLENVLDYIGTRGLSLRGMACFDCDSLMTASRLALAMGNRFPSPQSIYRARNKFKAKKIWRKAGVQTPNGIIASGLADTLSFFHHNHGNVVLKPISGSGSELVFHCQSESQVIESVDILEKELPKRLMDPLSRPMFNSLLESTGTDACPKWVVESFIAGPEFSCDFILDNGRIEIIRSTGKIRAANQTFGSILAYTFPPKYPDGFINERLVKVFEKASTSLGFDWGHFMVDFIIRENEPFLLELTPRPGGDSIPDLIESATGKDLIGIYLDLVSGRFRPMNIPHIRSEAFASINLYAPGEGIITRLDESEIASRSGMRAVVLKKKVGDTISLPPTDYDNRLLGYCVLYNKSGMDLVAEHNDLAKALKVSISQSPCRLKEQTENRKGAADG